MEGRLGNLIIFLAITLAGIALLWASFILERRPGQSALAWLIRVVGIALILVPVIVAWSWTE